MWLLIQLYHSRNMSRIFLDQLSTIFAIFEFIHIMHICIRIHLNKATAISLANALVRSRLALTAVILCCSVVPEKYQTSLQRVPNCLDRVANTEIRNYEVIRSWTVDQNKLRPFIVRGCCTMLVE